MTFVDIVYTCLHICIALIYIDLLLILASYLNQERLTEVYLQLYSWNKLAIPIYISNNRQQSREGFLTAQFFEEVYNTYILLVIIDGSVERQLNLPQVFYLSYYPARVYQNSKTIVNSTTYFFVFLSLLYTTLLLSNNQYLILFY